MQFHKYVWRFAYCLELLRIDYSTLSTTTWVQTVAMCRCNFIYNALSVDRSNPAAKLATLPESFNYLYELLEYMFA